MLENVSSKFPVPIASQASVGALWVCPTRARTRDTLLLYMEWIRRLISDKGRWNRGPYSKKKYIWPHFIEYSLDFVPQVLYWIQIRTGQAMSWFWCCAAGESPWWLWQCGRGHCPAGTLLPLPAPIMIDHVGSPNHVALLTPRVSLHHRNEM